MFRHKDFLTQGAIQTSSAREGGGRSYKILIYSIYLSSKEEQPTSMGGGGQYSKKPMTSFEPPLMQITHPPPVLTPHTYNLQEDSHPFTYKGH